MNKKARLTAIGLAVVSALVMGGCGSGSTTPKPEAAKPTTAKATPTPTLLPVPEGCPTSEEFSQSFVSDPSWATTFIDSALVSTALTSALPDGACAYVVNKAGTATDGSEYYTVYVIYFNIDTPGRPTHADLVKWAVDAGGTPALDSATDVTSEVVIDLPTEFSKFTDATFQWVEGQSKDSTLFYGEDIIPAFTQRAHAVVHFYLEKKVAEPLLAASAAGLDPTDKSKALAAGIPLTSVVTFGAKDPEGYTVEYDVKVTLQPFTTDVTNSAPGKYEIISTANVTGTVKNTTPQRNVTTGAVDALFAFPDGSPACTPYNDLVKVDRGNETPANCAIRAVGLESAELGPDGALPFPDQNSDKEFRFGPVPEGGPELGAYNTPIAVYAALRDSFYGGTDDWESDKGCEVFSGNTRLWVIPMEGWPDPICNP